MSRAAEPEPGPRVELELDPALEAAVCEVGREAFVEAVATRATQVMVAYGIPGRARAALSSKEGGRAARVFVDGRISPYPPSFVRRLWFGLSPPSLQAVAFNTDTPDRYRDAWLVACARQPATGTRDAVRELVLRLAVEVIGLRPSLLMHADAAGVADEHDPLIVVGRALVDRGVKLPDLGWLAGLLREHSALGRSPIEALEDVYAALRAPALELHLHRDVLERLTAGAAGERIPADDARLDPDMVAAMTAIRDYHLLELGVRLPVVLVGSGHVEPDELRVKINDRLGPPIPIPRATEMGVSAPMSRLAAHGIEARPLLDAVTGHEFAAVRAEDAALAQALGLLPARPGAYIAAAFGRALSPLAHRLLSVVEVENDLAALEESFPSLVHGALARFRLATITQVFRELVRDQVSIRDPWRVLNAMVSFATLAHLGEPDLMSEVLSDQVEWMDGSEACADGRLMAFVRQQIGDRIVYDSGAIEQVGARTMPVYVTERGFDARLGELAAEPDADPDAALIALRDDVWRALGEPPPAEPVFLTDRRVRRALRWVLAYELPGARVIARSELPPEVDLRPLGVVTSSA
jgi:hypothetical protein